MRSENLGLGSFRDPSGFIFRASGLLYRQVNACYREDYDRLMGSGLYERLVNDGRLIPHTECCAEVAQTADAYRVIQPQPVPFVSYPYEWSFSQLKAAALATLRVQQVALEFGMSLKDASAYNIQFMDGRAVLIDTLSVERYSEGSPWVAYRQFCQHFLAPLALVSYCDVRLSQLLRIHVDGVPLDLASRLLPRRSLLAPSLLMHLHLHAAAQTRLANDSGSATPARRVSRLATLGMIDSLQSAVRRLRWKHAATNWDTYYAETHNYREDALREKETLVARFLERVQPATVWDLGSNTGRFSAIAAAKGAVVVSMDADAACVEANYLSCHENQTTGVLPLVVDLSNPSPRQGWAHGERLSLLDRGPADVVMALALIHHLAIGNNVPLAHLARFLGDCGNWLIAEFVPKEDSQVRGMLASREDIFADYTQETFEKTFSTVFKIHDRQAIEGTVRTLYLMERSDPTEC